MRLEKGKTVLIIIVLFISGVAFAKVNSLENAISALESENDDTKREARQYIKNAGTKGFDALQKSLETAVSPQKRAPFVEALGLFSTPQAEKAVENELGQENPLILEAALKAVAFQQKKSYLPRVVELMGSIYPEVRRAAVEALIKYGGGVKEQVKNNMVSPNPRVRACALEAAAAIGIEGIEKQLALAMNDADPYVAAGAIKGLGRLQNKEMLPQIINLSQSFDAIISAAATEALTFYSAIEAEEALAAVLVSPADDNAKIIALESLSQKGAQGVEALLVANAAAGDTLKAAIGKAVRKIADPVVISTLSSETVRADPYRAQSAAELLLAVGDEGVEALFIQLHNTQDQLAKQNMKTFFVSMGERMVPRLNKELKSGDAEYREVLLEILGTIGDPSSIKPIAELISSPSPKIRRAVVGALASYDDPKVLTYLTPLAKDSDPSVREAVIRTAISLAGEQSIDLLIEGLKDSKSDTRLQCIAALGKTASPKAIKPLAALIGAAEGYEQLYAIEALGKIKHPEATKALMNLVASSNPKVSQAAQKALK